jgi:HK97 family phage major capsid protein
MKNKKIITERLTAIEAELRTLHTGAEARAEGERDFTADEQTRWAALETEETELREALAEIEAEESRASAIAERRARWASVQVAPSNTDDPFDLRDLRGASAEDVRARAITAVSEVRYAAPFQITDEHRQSVVQLVERIGEDDDDALARYALTLASPAYMSAFRSWLKSGGQPVYTPAEAEAVRASMSLTSANGGYAMPTLLDPTLIQTGTITKNPIRAISRVETGMVKTWQGVTISNVTTAWKGEGSAFTDGSPTTGPVSVTSAALTAYVTASYELFQDTAIQGQLPGLIEQAIDMAEGVAFLTGSGSDAPKGVITAVSGTAGSLVTATTRGAFTSASIVDTLAVVGALPARYEDSSTWVMNKATYRTIEQQMVGTGAVKAIEMTNGKSLLDLPVVRASSVTSTTTSGNFLIVLGDFGQFVIYDRIGVNLEFIQNVVDGSGIPTGQRGLVAYKRVGSDVSDVNAFRLLKA